MVHPSLQAASFVALLICSTQILAFNDVSNAPRDSRMSGQSDTIITAADDDANAHNVNASHALNQSKPEDSSSYSEETVQIDSTDQAQSLASSSYYYNQEQHKERYKHHVSKRLALSGGR